MKTLPPPLPRRYDPIDLIDIVEIVAPVRPKCMRCYGRRGNMIERITGGGAQPLVVEPMRCLCGGR